MNKSDFDAKEAVKVITLMKESLAEKGTVTEKALDMAIKELESKE